MTKEEKLELLKTAIMAEFEKHGIKEYIVYFLVDEDHIGSVGHAKNNFINSVIPHLQKIELVSDIADISIN